MELHRAKVLLRTLADGINPLTGENLPPDDSANQAEIVRALYTVLNSLDHESGKRSAASPENAGKPWDSDNDEKLCQLFDSGMSLKDLTDYFKRSKGSITSRLVRLGKISKRDDFTL